MYVVCFLIIEHVSEKIIYIVCFLIREYVSEMSVISLKLTLTSSLCKRHVALW